MYVQQNVLCRELRMAENSILIPLEYHSFVHDFNGFYLHIFIFF